MKTPILYVFAIICVLFSETKLYSQSETIKTTGDVFLLAIPATALGMTLFKKDKKGTWQFTKGLLLSQALTFTLKEVIDKPRPDLSNDNSFPSGHTSTTFQGASFIQKRYGLKYGIPAYLLASFTAYSRLKADKHDGYDVLLGAIIGVGSSYLFTTPYQKEHLELTYTSFDKNHLIGFKYKF